MNALILLGGGARGAYQVGVIRSIRELSVPIDIVCGSSVGAINAAMVAAGRADDLEQYWLQMSTRSVLSPRVDLWRLRHWRAMVKSGAELTRLLQHEIPWETIREGYPKLVVEMTNLETGEHEIADNQTCTWRHLLASSAIPMIFPPVRIGVHDYVDGTLTQGFPLLPPIQHGADTLYVVSSTCDRPRAGRISGLYEMAGRSLEIFLHYNLRHDLNQLEKTNNLVREGRDQAHRIVRAIPFYPCDDLGEIADFLNFSRDRITRLIELGYRDGKRALESVG